MLNGGVPQYLYTAVEIVEIAAGLEAKL